MKIDPRSQPQRASGIHPRRLARQSLNLNAALGTALREPWNVEEITHITISATKRTGTWTTAAATVRASIDLENWTDIDVIGAAGNKRSMKVAGFAYVNIFVTVAEGGVSTADFVGFGYIDYAP